MRADVRQTTGSASGVPLLLQRAEAAVRESNVDEARRLLKAVLRHDPTNERALLSLVFLAEDGQASLTYLARLLDAHPHHPQARMAVRWARRLTPTSRPRDVTRPAPETSRPPRRSHRMAFGLVALVMLIGLALLWAQSRSPAAPVQADAALAASPPLTPSPTARSLLEIVQVSIPLFTPTPASTPTPSSSPTPTPNSAWVPVVGHTQTYNLSCESRSSADLATYWGVPVDELEFLASLGQSDNPHQGFVGDVTMLPGSLPPYGYGVYAEPVAAALQDYGLDALPVYDLGLDGLRSELLGGRPVLVWATYDMALYDPVEWVSSDGRASTVVPFMHTFLATGFDDHGLYVLDAYDAIVKKYPFETFLDAWNLFDQMAVTVSGPLP